MASKYLTGTYGTGYAPSGAYQTLTIGSAGSIGGTGFAGGGAEAYTVANYGKIRTTATSASGIGLVDGGTVDNGSTAHLPALISGGAYGVRIAGGLGTVSNLGTIEASVGAHGVNDLTGTGFDGGRGGIGVELFTGGSVANSGLVEGATGGRGGNGGQSGAAPSYIYYNGGIAVGSGGTASLTNSGLLAKSGGTAATVIAAPMQDTGTITVASSVLDVTGTSNSFAGTIGGSGTIEFGGGASAISSGGTLTIAAASVQGAGTTVTLGEKLAYAGSLAVGTGTTLALGANTLTLTGSSSFAGTVSGSGTLALAGGGTTLSNGATIAAHVAFAGAAVTLTHSETISGGFSQSSGTVSLASFFLTLTNTAAFTGGTIAGAGDLQTNGASTLAALTLDAGAIWQDYGKVTETGGLTLGNAGGSSGRLVVESGGTFDITGNVGVAVASSGTAGIANAALFEKAGGTGISTIAPAFSNTGKILVTAGTLDLAAAVSGVGQATIGVTGTLEFVGSVAATQTIAFAGTTGGDLVLDDPSGSGLGFAGTVAGFSGTDKLDLATFAFSGNPTIGWSQTNSSSGTLTVTDGSEVAKITLFGKYVQSGFGKGHDSGTGTVITYTPPVQIALSASRH